VDCNPQNEASRGITAEFGRTGWLSCPTENFKYKSYRTDSMTGAFQENLSSRPPVLLFKDRGIERIGKRDDERSISGDYTRAERK
jgi:hypothetical protein